MIGLYKDLEYLYYVILSIGIVILFILSLVFNFNAIFWIILIIYAILITIVLNNIATKRTLKISNLFCDELKIKEFISIYEQKLLTNKNLKVDSFIRLNLSSGYLCLGEFNKVLSLFNQIPLNILPRFYQIEFLLDLARAYWELDNIDKYNELLNNAKKMLETSKFNKKIREVVTLKYTQLIFLEKLKKPTKNNLKETEKFYLELLNTTTTKLNKVIYSFYLTNVYYKLNDDENMKKYASYVFQNKECIYYINQLKKLNIDLEK